MSALLQLFPTRAAEPRVHYSLQCRLPKWNEMVRMPCPKAPRLSSPDCHLRAAICGAGGLGHGPCLQPGAGPPVRHYSHPEVLPDRFIPQSNALWSCESFCVQSCVSL